MSVAAAPTRTCGLIELGLTPYQHALGLQRRLAALRAEGRLGDLLLLLHHPPVITLGRGGRRAHLLVEDSCLAALGIEFFEAERGGDMTYHGPGQLVGYPILDLAGYGRDLHRYLRLLERVLIETLAAFGVGAGRRMGRTGVWVEDKKIASIGIHVTRWVTRHGFALNVDMDLSPFGLIVPCGIRGAGATSMAQELSRPVAIDEVIPVLTERFQAGFGVRFVPAPSAAPLGALGGAHEDPSDRPPLREAVCMTPLA